MVSRGFTSSISKVKLFTLLWTFSYSPSSFLVFVYPVKYRKVRFVQWNSLILFNRVNRDLTPLFLIYC